MHEAVSGFGREVQSLLASTDVAWLATGADYARQHNINSASKVEVIDKAHMVVANATVPGFPVKMSSSRGQTRMRAMCSTGVRALPSQVIGYRHAVGAGK